MMQHNPPHPGEILKDSVFDNSTLTVTHFAKQIGVTRAALSRVLNGKAAVSPDMALRFADALGGRAESWLHIQADYDLWQARQKPRYPIKRLTVPQSPTI